MTAFGTIRDSSNVSSVGSSRRSNRGFTGIEIMIVLGIIGVILLISVPSYRKARDMSRIKRAEAGVEMLANAVRQLMWDTGDFPGGLSKLDTTGTEVWNLVPASAGLLGSTTAYSGWRGPYLRKIENDPWGSPYFFDPDYLINGVNKVVVGSFGPNKQGQNVYDSDNIYVILN